MSQTPSKKILDQHAGLVRQIREHDRRYYVEDVPKISDHEYDQLYRALVDLEAKHPELRTEDSPTQRVGGEVVADFEKVTRTEKMMSLDNTYSEDELRAFHERVIGHLGPVHVKYAVDPKIDGLGIECTYEGGKFVQGATRGDGLVGENVTANLRTIRSIPLELRGWEGKSEPIHIRGEIYIERDDLERINEDRVKEGLPEFKNPRNAAAGSVRILDSKVTAKRPLRAIFYHLVEGAHFDTSHSQSIGRLSKWGIPVHREMSIVEGIDEVLEVCHRWKDRRHELPFDVDGLVIKVDSYAHQRSLGKTSKFPRWAIAFKYEAERATTRVLDVRIQVGRTGVLTPVADLEPVLLAGTTVSHASLHNFEEVERKDIRVGDMVQIEKAGEIIPQVVEVQKSERKGSEKKVKIPSKCPACNGPVGKSSDDEVALRCLNGISCSAQRKESIRYFASRRAMNIDGLGPALVDQLVDSGLVKTVADLFELSEADLVPLERMAEKSAQNLISAISKARIQATLARLLTALGIPQVGEVAAQTLAAQFGALDRLIKPQRSELEAELQEIHGVGPKMAQAISEFFANPSNRKVLEKLQRLKVNPRTERIKTEGPLKGLTFCITGTLSKSRDEVRDEIVRAGGKWAPSVSKETNYLVAGENVGANKLDAARKKNVKVISEAELYRLIGGGS